MGKLRIRPEHYLAIETAIRNVLAAHPAARDDYAAQGLSDKRFRWDVLRAARIEGDSIRWLCDTLYADGLTDAHIDNALRRIVREAS